MTQAEQTMRWRERYRLEVERSIQAANKYNQSQEWTTRPMTAEEYKEAFGTKTESCHRLKLNIKGDRQ